MKNIHWKKLLLIVISLNILPWLYFVVQTVALNGEILDGFATVAFVFLFALIVSPVSALVVSFFVPEKRFKHFFVALLCAVLVNLAFYSAAYSLVVERVFSLEQTIRR